MSDTIVVEVPTPIVSRIETSGVVQANITPQAPIRAVISAHGGSSDPAEIRQVVNQYLNANLSGIISDQLDDILSSGGSVFIDEGEPPAFIEGARIGDVYIDSLTGLIYEMEEG